MKSFALESSFIQILDVDKKVLVELDLGPVIGSSEGQDISASAIIKRSGTANHYYIRLMNGIGTRGDIGGVGSDADMVVVNPVLLRKEQFIVHLKLTAPKI